MLVAHPTDVFAAGRGDEQDGAIFLIALGRNATPSIASGYGRVATNAARSSGRRTGRPVRDEW